MFILTCWVGSLGTCSSPPCLIAGPTWRNLRFRFRKSWVYRRARADCRSCTVDGLTGRRFAVTELVAHGESLHHTRYSRIQELIEASRLAADEKTRALDIFCLLAEAESAVHGLCADDVSFHEVGPLDSLVDIVTAAQIIERLGPCSWSTSAIPVGSGRVRCQHGIIPIPAPATALLLRGLELTDDGIPGERVTPTGAAILKNLRPAAAGPSRPMILEGSGTGFGDALLPGIPNIVRVLLYGEGRRHRSDQVSVIAFEIDDQTPEDLAHDRLNRNRFGAPD